MLSPGAYDLPATRDDDISFDFYVRGRDSQGNKTVLNLTGYTLEAKVKDSAGVVSTATATFNNASQGFVHIAVSRTVTAAFPKGNGTWYFAMTSPGGVKVTYLEGQLLVRDRGDKR